MTWRRRSSREGQFCGGIVLQKRHLHGVKALDPQEAKDRPRNRGSEDPPEGMRNTSLYTYWLELLK